MDKKCPIELKVGPVDPDTPRVRWKITRCWNSVPGIYTKLAKGRSWAWRL